MQVPGAAPYPTAAQIAQYAPSGMSAPGSITPGIGPGQQPGALTGMTQQQRMNALMLNNQALMAGQGGTGGSNAGGFGPITNSANDASRAMLGNVIAGRAYNMGLSNQQSQPASSSTPGLTLNDAGLTRDQYLQLLSNPGPPRMPGATVPQVAPGYQAGVTQAFLQNAPAKTTGAGNYNNSTFFNTLRQLSGNPSSSRSG
jgi:hypothetical protein